MKKYILNEKEYNALDEFLTVSLSYDDSKIGHTNIHGDFGIFDDEECVSLKTFIEVIFIQGYQKCVSPEKVKILNELYNKLEDNPNIPTYQQYIDWCEIKDDLGNTQLSNLSKICKDKEILLTAVLDNFKELEYVPKCLRNEIGINALKTIYGCFTENEKEYNSNEDYIKYIEEYGKNCGLIDKIVETSEFDYSIVTESKETQTAYWSASYPRKQITEDFVRLIQNQYHIKVKDIHNTMGMVKLFKENDYISVDNEITNKSKYVFDGELELNDDCIYGYLITTDELVKMVINQGLEEPNDEMENINFYVDFNIENNNIKLIYSYYMMDEYYSGVLEVSSDELELIIEIMRDYCEKTYSQSLSLMYTEFYNETEINCEK